MILLYSEKPLDVKNYSLLFKKNNEVNISELNEKLNPNIYKTYSTKEISRINTNI